MATTKEVYAFAVIERASKDFGLALLAIGTDNSTPFASPSAFFGRQALGVVATPRIGIERIKSGNPRRDGRHERMRLT